MSENGWKAFSVLWVRAEVKIASTQQRPADLARHSESSRSAFPNLRSNGDSGLRLCGRYLRKLSAIWRSSLADRNVSLGSTCDANGLFEQVRCSPHCRRVTTLCMHRDGCAEISDRRLARSLLESGFRIIRYELPQHDQQVRRMLGHSKIAPHTDIGDHHSPHGFRAAPQV